MTKGLRNVIVAVAIFVLVLPVGAFMLSVGPDATPRAKVAEVLLYLSSTFTEMHERCTQGSLPAEVTNASLGFPDPYRPGPRFIERVTFASDESKRIRITVILEDIHLDVPPFWSQLAIPAGAELVFVGSCDGKGFDWSLHRSTTVPSRYLPERYRAAKAIE